MPVFYLNAKERYRADALTALKQLNAQLVPKNVSTASLERISQLDLEHAERLALLAIAEIPREDGLISGPHLVASIRDAVPKDTLFMIEAVTMTSSFGTLLCVGCAD